jgi:hypothetical protein
MAQLSRPYQIGLVVVALFAAVFVFALHGRSSTTSSASAPAPATPASTPAAQASANGGSTGSAAEQAALSHQVYHGSAPGVSGLSRAIAKAHGAAATSEKNNAQLAQKSTQASSVTSSSTTTSTPAGTVTKHTVVVTHAPKAPSASAKTTAASAAASAPKAVSTTSASGPARQHEVEAELKQGKIVVLLFWNPKGTDDRVVHHQLKLMFAFHNNAATAKAEAVRHAGKFFGRNFNNSVVVHETLGASVAAYGSITRGVQVFQTPTLLVLNSKGQTIALTGVTDAYGIEQAIFEAHGS